MVRIENIKTGYYKKQILNNVTLEISRNAVYLLVGPNGAGKSTLLKTIAGFLKPWEGSIWMDGVNITYLAPSERAKRGIGYFFQGGEVFKDLTVKENLEIAGICVKKENWHKELNLLYQIFPKLKDFESKRAGLLSGGERHQLALSMVFVRTPELILLDEPSAGLAPSAVKDVLAAIKDFKSLHSSTILIVEQNIPEGLKVADFVFFMKAGEIIDSAKPAEKVELSSIENLFFK